MKGFVELQCAFDHFISKKIHVHKKHNCVMEIEGKHEVR